VDSSTACVSCPAHVRHHPQSGRLDEWGCLKGSLTLTFFPIRFYKHVKRHLHCRPRDLGLGCISEYHLH
jgi:hypothetical protein